MECERGKAEQEIEIREKTCQLVRSFPAESEYKSRQTAETVHWTWTPFSSTLRGDARKCRWQQSHGNICKEDRRTNVTKRPKMRPFDPT